MKCSGCSNESPENVIHIRKEYVCPICIEKPFENFKPLKVELHEKYDIEYGMKYVYISDLENNLNKIQKHFQEHVNLVNPFFTITLILAPNVDQLSGIYDGLYIDDDLPDKETIAKKIKLQPGAFVKRVHATKQIIL